MSYNRVHVQEEDFSDDCIGAFALGAGARAGRSRPIRVPADWHERCSSAPPPALKCGPRGMKALPIMGLDAFIEGGEAAGLGPRDSDARSSRSTTGTRTSADDWRWF
ncbi:MAG: hypothetical protein R3B46_10590 [Phycisphaerales bacterium]